MKHVLIKDPKLNGWEYGMLRSFEEAIIRNTGAVVTEIDKYNFASQYMNHFGQGMRRARYRRYFPKQNFTIEGDVAWHILMGPENYQLDIYKNWNKHFKIKILYIYDTLPFQYPLIKRLFSNGDWDLLITSLNDAVDDLKKITGRQWHFVEQAADSELFAFVPFEERKIHFSSYGRRYAPVHETVKEFCNSNGLYYDYTTHDGRHPITDAKELYRQYAWHLCNSFFTFSWPIELTNPQRAGHLHPITCRWFEAAAARTIVLGKAPENEYFNELFGDDFVYAVDPNGDRSSLFKQLEQIWSQRNSLSKKFPNYVNMGWDERVKRILSFL